MPLRMKVATQKSRPRERSSHVDARRLPPLHRLCLPWLHRVSAHHAGLPLCGWGRSHGHRGMRWCNECRNPRDVEGAQPTIEPLQIELDTLRATFATPGYRVKRWVSRLLRQDAGTLVVRAVELRAAKDRARKKVQMFGCRPHRAHYQQNPASSAVPALNWNTICFK